jgi:hypothetical protein
MINKNPTVKDDIVGDYISNDKFGYNDIIHLRARQVRTSLLLFEHGKFHMKTCAMEISGTWQIEKGNLYLYCQSRKFIIDRFNYDPEYSSATLCSEKPDIFKIKKGRLIQKNHSLNIRKRYILELRKIEVSGDN